MYGLPILPFWNNLKNFTWSLRPSDSLPPVSPPFWRHIAKSDFLIFGNHISRDHISDLWTGISSVGSLNATFHCHCFTLFQCFSSFFSSPSQISWFFANRISQDHISDLLSGISQSPPPHCRLQFCFVDSVFFTVIFTFAHFGVASNCAMCMFLDFQVRLRWPTTGYAPNMSGMNKNIIKQWIITCPDKASPSDSRVW